MSQNLSEEERHDRDLLDKYRHYENLAINLLSHNGTTSYNRDQCYHLASMLLLLDIARGKV